MDKFLQKYNLQNFKRKKKIIVQKIKENNQLFKIISQVKNQDQTFLCFGCFPFKSFLL